MSDEHSHKLATLIFTMALALAGVATLLWLWSGLPQAALAQGPTATITVPDDYPTIQQAVDAASPGSTVYVRAGTYYEHVTIGKVLTLQGQDRQTTIIDGSGSGTGLYVTADGVSISGLTVRNGSSHSIHLYQADNCHIDNVLVTSNPHTGLYLQASTYNTVTNSIVSNNQYGFNTGDQGSHHNTFQNVEAYSNTYAVMGYAGSHYLTVLDSHLYNNEAGVSIGWSQNWRVENTAIYSNATGIGIDTASYGTVENCEVYSNTDGFYFCGLGQDHNTIVSNRIYSNTRSGLYLYNQARYNTISENEIHNNGWGVYINKHTSMPNHSNIFYHNNFADNTINALVHQDEYANTWDNGYPSGGNYWDDYTGADLYSGPAQDQPGGDGIGDIPYVITGTTNIDRYPLHYTVVYLPLVMKAYCSCGPDNYEPNDSFAQAYGPLTSGQTYQSWISCCDVASRRDYFYVDISTTDTINVDLTNIPAGVDYDLYLYNSAQVRVAQSQANGNLPEHISYNPPSAGRYYILVFSPFYHYSASPYSLRVTYN